MGNIKPIEIILLPVFQVLVAIAILVFTDSPIYYIPIIQAIITGIFFGYKYIKNSK